MHITSDIDLINWSVMTFVHSGNKRIARKTRRNNIKPFKSVLPTIHEDAELLFPAVINAVARAASRKHIASARTSSYERLTKSEIAAFFKQHRIAAKQIREKKQSSSQSTTT
jgi:hypothetical protein